MNRTRTSEANVRDDLAERTNPACWAASQSPEGFQDSDLVETPRLEALCDGVFAIIRVFGPATSATGRPFPSTSERYLFSARVAND